MSPAMNEQLLPVEDSEFVYRRIHRSFYDPSLSVPIQLAAFRPNERDTTGLSVFRARFVQPGETLSSIAEAKRNDYLVVRIAVRDLIRLGLSVVPEPAPDGPAGHAIIPELRWDAYQTDKQRLKEILLELATLASREIVHRPT